MKIILNENMCGLSGNFFSPDEIKAARDQKMEFEVQRLANGGVWITFKGEAIKVWEYEYEVTDYSNVPDFPFNITSECSTPVENIRDKRIYYSGVYGGENLTRVLRNLKDCEEFNKFLGGDVPIECLQAIVDEKAIFLDPNQRYRMFDKGSLDIRFLRDITLHGPYWEYEMLIVNLEGWKNLKYIYDRDLSDIENERTETMKRCLLANSEKRDNSDIKIEDIFPKYFKDDFIAKKTSIPEEPISFMRKAYSEIGKSTRTVITVENDEEDIEELQEVTHEDLIQEALDRTVDSFANLPIKGEDKYKDCQNKELIEEVFKIKDNPTSESASPLGFFRDKRMDEIAYARLDALSDGLDIPTDDFISDLGWIAPTGEWYSCTYGGHTMLSATLLAKMNNKPFEEYSYRKYDHDNVTDLLDLGWIQVQNPVMGPTIYSTRHKCTKAQYDTLYKLCQKHTHMAEDVVAFLEFVEVVD